jgi:PAS domain S-box-containing protein
LRPIIPIIFLALFAISPAIDYGANGAEPGNDDARIELTDQERQWLARHPVIRVAPDPDYQPIESFDKAGTFEGMSADYLKLIEKKLGIRFQIVRLSNWDEAMAKAKNREVDMLSAATKTASRAKYMLFTTPHITLPGVIIVHSKAGSFRGLEEFRGKKVGVVSSYVWQEWITRDHPDIKLQPVRDMQAGLLLVSFRQMDAMVGNLATSTHYLKKLGITNLRVAAETGYYARLAMASRNDWPELNSVLQKAVSSIGPAEHRDILGRWIKLGTSTVIDTTTILLVLAAFVGVAGAAVGGNMFWNYSLREMVRRQSRSLRESEEQVRLLLDSTGEAIYGIDLDGNCTFANPACLKTLGYKDTSDLLGRNMHELIHHTRTDGTPYPIAACQIYQCFLQGEGMHVDDEVLWRADRTSFPAEYWSHPIISDDQITGAVVAFVDITERMEIEDQLRQAQKMEAIGQLTGGVAHDFNNLLTVILGNAEILHERHGDGDGGKMTEAVMRAAMRGSELTQRLLSFSRRQSLSPRAIDPNALIAGMADMMRRTLGEQIEIEIKSTKGLCHVQADPAQLENALLNLAINARDSMPDGGTLHLETAHASIGANETSDRTELSPGDYVTLAVTDTGHGMPPDVMERVFEPFFTTKGVGEGSGLGLSMVYGFAVQSGGGVSIDSTQGDGTTVTLYLPSSPETPQEEASDDATDVTSRKNETILVIEDEPDVRMLTARMLEDLGYEVVEAANGAEGIAAFQNTPDIRLVLTDVVLPEKMSGPELVAELKAHRPDVKAMFMSGYPDKAITDKRVFEDGAGLLSKPFKKRDLALKIRGVLDKAVGAEH